MESWKSRRLVIQAGLFWKGGDISNLVGGVKLAWILWKGERRGQQAEQNQNSGASRIWVIGRTVRGVF